MRNIYFRIAFNAISKKRIVYIPYIFSTAIMGMVLYLLISLSRDAHMTDLIGGEVFAVLAKIGAIIFFILSTIFSIYISFFITRGRHKEYAVLNVLGLEKKHLTKIIFIENLILSVSSSVIGIIGGIVFYKLIELAVIKFLGGLINYEMSFEPMAVAIVFLSYLLVYSVISVIQVALLYLSRPVEYMKSASKGERKGKLYVLFTLAGIAILAIAYKIEYSIPPDLRITNFIGKSTRQFIFSSILIVAATFLLFIFGSVTVLSLVRKNKRFFYRKNNFISLSTLIFRMRRSAIGLGTICILSTLAIVLASALISFAVSADEYLNSIAPETFIARFAGFNGDTDLASIIGATGGNAKVKRVYESFPFFMAYTNRDKCYHEVSETAITEAGFSAEYFSLIDEVSYTALTGEDPDITYPEFGVIMGRPLSGTMKDASDQTHKLISLKDSESVRSVYGYNNILVFPGDPEALLNYYLGNDFRFIVNIEQKDYDMRQSPEELATAKENFLNEYYSFRTYVVNVDASYAEQYYVYINTNVSGASIESATEDAVNFISAIKGLFFLCSIIMFLFIIMMVVTLYYKNLFEGIEDAPNYEIMRKLGMDDKLINRTVYTHMIISLVLPIALAAVHAMFSERYVIGIIRMFEIRVTHSFQWLVILSTVIVTIIYLFIGIIASGTYIKIVKGKKQEV